ncbi:MAG TPA: hypothetical protein VG410_00415 [Solirubrobacteraceae bacterium]|jgi:hypothetical protein|nr:hypothetical protein [Solirubrobacteraceae bacterium]
MNAFATPFPGRRAIRGVLLIVVIAVGLSACGSSASTSTSASGSTNDPARYQARLSLAKCLRGQGLNVPDPSPNAGPAGGGGVFRELQGVPRTKVQNAMTACKQYVAAAFPRANLSPAQQAQFRQEFVKFAECMRSHGVNIPDPSTSTGGGFGLRGAFGSVDRNSPAFRSAMTACQSVRPRFGRGGAGGPGGGPPPGGAPGA